MSNLVKVDKGKTLAGLSPGGRKPVRTSWQATLIIVGLALSLLWTALLAYSLITVTAKAVF
jgi:hypothetical protein